MTYLPDPRGYWLTLSDEELIAGRDECRALDIAWLLEHADNIDDELERRKDYRRRGGTV